MPSFSSIASSAGMCLRSTLRHRRLVAELARRDVSDRYAGQVFGTVWAVVHPLTMIAVFIFVFAVVFPARIEVPFDIPADYTVYMLSGLIPWIVAADAFVRAPAAVLGQANLVKQVVFPVEVLPLKIVLSSLPTFLIGFTALSLYILIAFGFLHASHLLLPVAGALLYVFLIGVAYLLSALGVFVRDLGSLVQIYAFAGLYLAPIFYFIEWAPRSVRPLLYLNPMTVYIECFHDAAYRGGIATPALWLAAAALSGLSLLLGAAVFNRLKPQFGTFL